jgi:hypothetical protein|tara:strand:+ start:2261 stop:2455 length:195 start_codon:yes stop_codon:yes gene_type:complete
MDEKYFNTVTKLEEMDVNDDYILGWQEGYQGSPKVEEQRLTDAYEAGYADGEKKSIESATNFKK